MSDVGYVRNPSNVVGVSTRVWFAGRPRATQTEITIVGGGGAGPPVQACPGSKRTTHVSEVLKQVSWTGVRFPGGPPQAKAGAWNTHPAVWKSRKMAKAEKAAAAEVIQIKAPNFKIVQFGIVGTAPLVQARFSAKAAQAMRDKMEAGPTAGKGRKRDARDFTADMLGAMHISTEGWTGHPAAAFRNACIDVCRMVGFKMTFAKMALFIEDDGLDKVDGQPLVKLDVGKPEQSELAVRNATGVLDIRARPMWRKWGMKLRIKYDADQFTASDIANLLERAGQQIGIGEGRPFSKSSNGMGFGTFKISR